MKLDTQTINTIKDMIEYHDGIKNFVDNNPKRKRIALTAYDTFCGCMVALLDRILKENAEYRIFMKVGKLDMRFKENRKYK